MTTATSGAAGVIVGKRALHQMRAVLERETGAQAALLLREIGFATGSGLWEAFEAWIARPAETIPALADLARRTPSWER